MPHLAIDGVALGNHRYSNAKRTVVFQGLPIRIEIEVGDTKSGTDEAGRPWSHIYKVPYGEIPSSHALSDGDPVDVYVGPNPLAGLVYVVHQNRMDGSHDEDKVLLGFNSAGDAVLAYKQHGPDFGFGAMDVMTFDQFKHGYLAANRRHR